MKIQKRVLKSGEVRWKVRWRQGDRYRSQTFDRKGDAVTFAAEIRPSAKQLVFPSAAGTVWSHPAYQRPR